MRHYADLRNKLPTDGTMGILATNRPALYWLIVIIGTIAYLGLLLAALGALLILVATFGQTATTALNGDPYRTAAWFIIATADTAFMLTLVVIAARWVSTYSDGGN